MCESGRLPFVLLLIACTVSAGVAADALEQDRAARGASVYRVYCASCHGTGGAGDGPTAEFLLVKPADLTRIRQRNGGVFPFEQVLARIDGRQELPGHGTRTMPTWGIALQEWDRDVDQRDEIAGRLLTVTTFLKSIQRGDGE